MVACDPFLILWRNIVRKHVVFGKLISGHETLRKMENVDVDGDRPVVPVKIVNCGELKENVAVTHENGTRFIVQLSFVLTCCDIFS